MKRRFRLHFFHKRRRRRQAWRLLLFLVTLAGSLYFDLFTSNSLDDFRYDCSFTQQSHTSWLESKLYSPVARWPFRTPPASHVTLVSISDRSEPHEIMTNTCKGRLFMADLISPLVGDGAKVIAIDKFYTAGSCMEDEAGGANETFRAALDNATVPVVVGQATHGLEDQPNVENCLVKSDMFNFNPPGTKPFRHNVHFGLVRLNANDLKIPLGWKVFGSEDDAKARRGAPVMAGFSLVAAEQEKPAIAACPRLRKLIAKNVHPYAKFPVSVPPVSAMNVLCTSRDPTTIHNVNRWGRCSKHPGPAPNLRGRIVVVGDFSNADLRPFPGKDRYGSQLQADYIEAILDKSYIRPTSVWWDLSMIAFFFSFAYWSDWHYEGDQAWKSLVWDCGIFIGLLLISLACLKFFDRFTALFFPAISVIFMLLAFRLVSLVRKAVTHS